MDRRAKAQTQDFANLTAELLAGRQGPDVQMGGMRLGVKVEKPETYSGEKTRDLDTWLFQVHEHLDITTIPARGHVPYAASLLHGNAALWWRETCKGNRHQLRGMISAGCCGISFGQKTTEDADAMS